MRIMVTGGAGFIGSHVVDELISIGCDVVVYDIVDPLISFKNVKAQYYKADVLDLNELKKSTKGIDYIYHLAAEANVNNYFNEPVYSTQLNTMGTINVCEAARNNSVKRVLFASTEWVYGASNEDVVDENTKLYPPMPDHIYTSSKIASEIYLMNYRKLYGVNYTIMRYGIPFGERARPETVTPIFIKKALNGDVITLDGGGKQFRQFIYIKDLAKGNVACLDKKAENEIININGGQRIRIIDIVRNLEKVMEKKITYKIGADRPGQFNGRFVKTEKAKDLLRWEAKVDYMDGLKSYYAWYLNNTAVTDGIVK